DQRVQDPPALAHAVDRLLDRQHVRIGRRRLDQLYDRLERVIGMDEQDVLFANQLEDAPLLFEYHGHERRLRLEAEPIVPGKIDQRLKRPRIERAGHLEDIGIFDSDAAAQQLAEVRRRLALDLESQRLPGASLSQLQLEAPHV